MNRQQRADQRSKAFHRTIADRLRAHPELWTIPEQNLQRWKHEMRKLPAALEEWNTLFHTRSHDEILTILTEDSQETDRLRSSSPFTGILTETERLQIFKTFSRRT